VLRIIESELGDELALAGYSHAGAAA
jgi:hypothetical protein